MHTNDTEVSQKRYKYNGKERDEESGLDYYGARYYASWLCRFISVDPQKDGYPMQNSFAYAANSPVTMIDVNGESPGGGEGGDECPPQSTVVGYQWSNSSSSGSTSLASPKGYTTTNHLNNNVGTPDPFWSDAGKYVEKSIVKGIKGAFYLLDNPNWAGFGYQTPTIEEIETYNNTVREIANPEAQLTNLVKAAVDGPQNIYHGVNDNDGAKFAEGSFQAVEVFAAIYGAKKLTPKSKTPKVSNSVASQSEIQNLGAAAAGFSKRLDSRIPQGKSDIADLKIIDQDDDFFQITGKFEDVEIEIQGFMNFEGDNLIITSADFKGPVGLSNIRKLVGEFGKHINVKQVHIAPAKRQTGANPGKTPAPFKINSNN